MKNIVGKPLYVSGRGFLLFNGDVAMVTTAEDDERYFYLRQLDASLKSFAVAEKVRIDDPRIDYTAPEFGYVNFRNSSLFLTRCGRRQWRQFTCSDNARAIVDGKVQPISLRKDDLIYLTKAYRGMYPTVADALARIREEGPHIIAVSKYVAISPDTIWYRGEKAAEISDGGINVNDIYDYLSADFEEVYNEYRAVV